MYMVMPTRLPAGASGMRDDTAKLVKDLFCENKNGKKFHHAFTIRKKAEPLGYLRFCRKFAAKEVMARPIRETPILFGKDAHRFLTRMQNPPKETAEKRAERLRHYKMALSALTRGQKARESGNMPGCIVKFS